MSPRRTAGFTLLEVMLALALMGLALVVLIKSAAGNIASTEEAHMMGIASDLARGKMYDIEEVLLKDGFTDTDQSQLGDQCFEDEGWPTVCYSYKVEEPKMPSFDELQAMAQGQAQAMGSGMGSGFGSSFGSGFGSDMAQGGLENSALGGMLGMMGMFGGGKQDIDAAQGGALIQSQYAMFQEILKVSVRKVTLTVKWKVLGKDRDMKVVAFFTDAAAMDKVLSGMGSQELPDNSSTGTGTGSGGTKTPTPPRPGRGGSKTP
ncbi:MAG TPA: prepilin-type N-terminal cleavage/methylation domain-containing protein [Kofleriaceae bacterium]|nr:prepilin-type N-terminal cleavage/methylation domain-containing protein [Kofleriaceae bacterium]